MSLAVSRARVLRREAISLDAPAIIQSGRCTTPRKYGEADAVFPRHHNPVQWCQAMDYARQACARIFRDGGKPSDALAAFGLTSRDPSVDWSVVVDRIAELLCAPRLSKAA
jgi:hypothetical protein